MAAWQGTEDLEEVLTDRFQELPPPSCIRAVLGCRLVRVRQKSAAI